MSSQSATRNRLESQGYVGVADRTLAGIQFGLRSSDDAHRRLQEGALLVDVRDPDFWTAGHVTGALHIPASQLAGRAAGLDRDRAVLVICQSGVMSLKCAKVLREAGVQGACSVRGEMTHWLRNGLPVEGGQAAEA